MHEKMKKHVAGTFEDGLKSKKFATESNKEQARNYNKPDFETGKRMAKVKE